MRLSTLVLISVLGLTPLPVKAKSGWSLSIQSSQDEVVTKGPLLLKVSLENTGDSPQVVFEGFRPPEDDDGPSTVLRFEVVREGEHVQFLGRMPPGHYGWSPHWSQFEEVSAGWFFGTTVDLQSDPWRIEPLQPGTYRIRARVEFHARAWFQKQYKINPNDETVRILYPQRELLAAGEVASNEITVHVHEAATE